MPRLKYASILQTLFILGLFSMWLKIILTVSRRHKEEPNDEELAEQILALVPRDLHKYLIKQPRNSSVYSELPITEIRYAIKRYNEAQTIYNEDIYGPVQNDTVIIAIQVHSRLRYLRYMIVSLAQARDINRTLLVFSHDYYDEDINTLIRSINFTKAIQIFYPYSIQTHPNEFPGIDPNDCPGNIKIEEAKKLKCKNAQHTDSHGHYREAKYTQIKHHWWWKANRIFNQLRCTASHSGMVVFIEEDHYVAEDFLHILKWMRMTADKHCPHCELLSLGTYLENKEDQYNASATVQIAPWKSGVHNMGMVLNRIVWNEIMSLQDQFCGHDDYNWDYSLLHLSENRKGKKKFKVMMCKNPRVFHIGECGLHHRGSNCNAYQVILDVQKLLVRVKHKLYPPQVTSIDLTVTRDKKLVTRNGGWGDLRDRELCTNMTKIGRQV